ncbi:MAG TPA: hypothetical protein VGP47_08305 [Parachlamydiaceae bacterium]|nr:hypothetical protein [Parachlamydiaceae bacterium]
MIEDTNFLPKKFKLTNEQIKIYVWLKEQGINADDETLCYFAKSYPQTRLKEVVEFANERIASGHKILNFGGFIRNLLQKGSAVVNDTCKFNREYALEFTKTKNWSDLKIYEKYVKDNVTGDDLPLTIVISEFKSALERLYQKSCLYR